MTSTTSQAVRDAREPGEMVREVWVEWAQRQPDAKPSWLTPWAELDAGQREVDALIESAVRADEATGLVDILARLLAKQWPGFQFCQWCGGKFITAWLARPGSPEPRVTSYHNHTSDCPWVEGMNAVAERRGQ